MFALELIPLHMALQMPCMLLIEQVSIDNNYAYVIMRPE